MQFSTSSLFALFFALFSAFSLTSAAPLTLEKRDVWDPKVTYPTKGTVWKSGSKYTVTWETSDEPAQVTNPNGQIYLRQGDSTPPNALASDFRLDSGSAQITVPSGSSGSDFVIVLMGDSGNWSGQFTIKN
ncbi:hypothetical protein FIBSPDRAFT_789637 [Athelia psychrophila]|uniref:Yeast cell wall synthesis Kre9/Knh1-like N-terminal domain-containing protein n=1 Tax=Athelia psychrophila TaxID=1759441 RepID=A0A166IXY0_9AGAM|nr:hypothetical protein FIBSPDRAFT_789637 [Fibularhizoctonia sp. CBS 109695]